MEPMMKKLLVLFVMFSTIALGQVVEGSKIDHRAGIRLKASVHSVVLTWQESTPGVTFNIYRTTGTTCTGMTLLGTSSVLSYTDAAVTNGQTYAYYATAVGTGGESGPSNCATAQIPSPPSPPTGLTATNN